MSIEVQHGPCGEVLKYNKAKTAESAPKVFY